MFISTHFFVGCLAVLTVALHVKASGIDIYKQTEYFEGDIILPETGRNGILAAQRWTNGIIPYVPLGDKFSQEDKNLFRGAVNEIEAQTCIRFVPRANETNYINVYYGKGCSSHVGMYGGQQHVSLADGGCWYHGIIVHELLHAVGLWHEQSRFDRDKFVYINDENISKATLYNFDLKFPNETDTYGVPYNYLSVMHYSADAFSKNGEATIETVDTAYQYRIGNRDFGSEGDYEKIRRMYKCSGTYRPMPLPAAVPAPRCEDKITYCDQQKAGCNKDAWMNDYCRLTCGFCNSGCKDDMSKNCRQYKKDCGTLDWMKTSCKRTCKLCKPF